MRFIFAKEILTELQMEVKLRFGVKNGALVDVADVQSGLACDCLCPSCGSRLVARKGVKTSHHFAHHNGDQCSGAVQSALHLAAKEILEKHKKIRLPAVICAVGIGNDGDWVRLHPEQTLEFDEVHLEKRLGEIIPDVILVKNGREMLVEIAVTHFVNEKKKKVIEENGITTLEVDLSSLDRQISLKDIEEILIDQVEHKNWIFNQKISLFKKDIALFSTEYPVLERRIALHIDNCPLNMRLFKGKSYANLIDDCFNCKYFHSSRGDGYSQHTHIGCLGNYEKEIEAVIAKHTKGK